MDKKDYIVKRDFHDHRYGSVTEKAKISLTDNEARGLLANNLIEVVKEKKAQSEEKPKTTAKKR